MLVVLVVVECMYVCMYVVSVVGDRVGFDGMEGLWGRVGLILDVGYLGGGARLRRRLSLIWPYLVSSPPC